ncbi:MAG: ATP-binding protein, partial [Thermoplasmatota archaeon]
MNREKELDSLENRYSKEGVEFIIITGRRRIGKTRLLQEFSKEKDPIFLMCEERKWEYNLDKFNKKIAENFDIPDPSFDSFRDCFEYISEKTKALVIIDEFSYLIRNKDILGEFQAIIDEVIEDMTLILSGSAVSMMKKHVLSHKSPLYGRSTSHLNIQPLSFPDLLRWFPDIDIADAVKIFGVCDGIPKYLEFFEGVDIDDEIIQNVFSPDAFLFREPKMLLEEELREPETYFQLLEAMSFGNTKTTDIANHSYMEAKNVVSYLSILKDLGFVKKEKSILRKRKKKGIYKIKDNFFKFWFRFISPNFAEIENWENDAAVNDFTENFDHYLGPIFEDVCRQFVRLNDNYAKVDRWWFREDEIDIVALNEREKKALFAECKWSKNPVGQTLLRDLKEKA